MTKGLFHQQAAGPQLPQLAFPCPIPISPNAPSMIAILQIKIVSLSSLLLPTATSTDSLGSTSGQVEVLPPPLLHYPLWLKVF